MGISKSDAWTKLTRNEYYRDIQSMKDRNADGNWDGLERLEKQFLAQAGDNIEWTKATELFIKLYAEIWNE